MREDANANVRPVQSTRSALRLRRRLPSTRQLFAVAAVLVVALVAVTGNPWWVYPVFGGFCVVWGMLTVVAASSPTHRADGDPVDATETKH